MSNDSPNTPSVHHSSLGQTVSYAGQYDPGRLFAIPRAENRAKLQRHAAMPMFGVDVWNAYELSWLDTQGKPAVAIAEIRVPAESTHLIESKSLKLYLNGFMQSRFESAEAVTALIRSDLSAAAGDAVKVRVQGLDEASAVFEPLRGECIDGLPLEVERYEHPSSEMLRCDRHHQVREVLLSHLLKSNCPVTGQPDWASVQIDYAGPALDRSALLRYLIAYREHAEFHEHCVEQIYCDLWQLLEPTHLAVYARYTRRGGIDINPFRASHAALQPLNARQLRQ
ncbi:NADPH-dependent 7-cyano-7-deazaguanine reductase QueF [Pseudomarimonas arenosa]|uniref:NADPH-dependent 7-cyano-7-deazaguanine reductase n=1 Tax=Pseudomarimonas arenosa TaxID=2774145 RepID=A0AAW3ZLZ4_9GAMM|nr:NADPH-dependent 7-cyano-7-deazaguanine reductase QueF [Pseudomarimonas arenosa]MBD8526763.1 NADPH-dependent 7-cyano-7-deazaguanine reductase QueF [Pseudomarimonas arenosa]